MSDATGSPPTHIDTSTFFSVDPRCRELGLRAAGLVFDAVRVAPSNADLRAAITREVAARSPAIEAAQSGPELTALHGILRSVGTTPRKTPPAVQRLRQLALKRKDLPVINNVVDSYNLVSVRTACCLGAHDVAMLRFPVVLRLLRGDEEFTPLGHTTPEPAVPGEFAYVDALNRVICRLDVMQADFSKVRDTTTAVFVVVEATSAHQPGALIAAAEDVTQMITQHCGGRLVARRVIQSL